jgi:hypothetical protein
MEGRRWWIMQGRLHSDGEVSAACVSSVGRPRPSPRCRAAAKTNEHDPSPRRKGRRRCNVRLLEERAGGVGSIASTAGGRATSLGVKKSRHRSLLGVKKSNSSSLRRPCCHVDEKKKQGQNCHFKSKIHVFLLQI